VSNAAKKLVINAAVVIFGAVVLLAGLYVYTTDFSFRPQLFVAEGWRAGDAKLRGTMLDDLLRKDILRSRSAQEVIALLGPPDSTNDPYFHGDHYLTYQVFTRKRLGTTPWPHYLHCVLSSPDGSVQRIYVAD
jgi:hypothetical protein